MQKSKLSRPSQAKGHPTKRMWALQIHGKENLKLTEIPKPLVTDSADAIVKVTATSIGGSDLNIYHNITPEMNIGCVTGRESVGVIDEIGPQVKNVRVGDRVVISPVIACGQCDYCMRNEWSCCETTNPSEMKESLPGGNIGALMGRNYDGGQAEYVRVPFADVNLFPIPDNITDKEALLVADVAPTGLHANMLADVKSGDTVVVIGCGAVGLMTQMWAKQRGASIVAIDSDQQRLNFAKEKLGSMTLNSKEEDILEAMSSLILGGPDKVIDCVGSQSPEGFLQKLQMALKMQTDSPNIVNLAIKMVRKNGRITLIGDYIDTCNNFNVGGMMEKHLTMNGGQVMPHNYQKEIFAAISSKKINPSILLTHSFPVSQLDEVYEAFDGHEDGMIKPFIVPNELYHGTNKMETE